jgi:hypothetical protein
MKAWSAARMFEISNWPQVSTRALFGFNAFHRKGKIFALLPRTRAMDSANSLAFKLETHASAVSAGRKKDSRIRVWSSPMEKARWFSFELSSHAELHDALEWLARAYEAAGAGKKSG